MSEAFKDVPEIFEVDLGESLAARTESLASFRELGPPDLCHVVKSTGKSGSRDLGSYHYISGVDASSSASLAAYINSLTYAMEESPAWFSKGTSWKVRNGCYCCFNAFSRVDIRVEVKMPGGVQAYMVDLRGERHETTSDIWVETYLSALLRAILYSDDTTYYLDAYRKLDPLTSPDSEIRFLQAVETLFFKGWQAGSDPEIQVATVVSNHLTAGIMKYFGDSGRYLPVVNLFERLSARESEVASLLARSYLGMNEEVKAVQVMAQAMKQTPQSYTLLHVQCDFLRSKGKLEWAIKLARQAVNCAPSEFVTWEKLADLYIDLAQYESALLTLNSCPMFTFNGRDAHRNLVSARVHLPFSKMIGDILPEKVKTDDDEADPALQRLPAPGLRGTWARAYALLTRLVSQIGWDELLKTRSAVFVMEEEYRMQKSQADMHRATSSMSSTAALTTADDASAISSREGDDDASTRGMVSLHVSPRPASVPNENGTDEQTLTGEPESPTAIPTIKISPGSAEEVVTKQVNGDRVNGTTPPGHDLERPGSAAGMAKNGDDTKQGAPIQSETFSFSNKRLCERWLDNLFMVLYEDLRVWTIFRAEVAHFKTQHVAYKKTGYEWEILGELGLRLHHKEEAKEAFQRCLDTPRYSQKPWVRLMEMYADEGDIQRCIQTAIRVAAYQHADYTEMTYPTLIARSFFKLGQIHGHAKISFTLLSMGLPDQILKTMDSYLHYGKVFRVEGYDF